MTTLLLPIQKPWQLMTQIISPIIRLFVLYFLSVSLSLTTSAQQKVQVKGRSANVLQKDKKKSEKNDGKNFDREKFNQELQTYLTKNAGITQEEGRRFFPVFFEYKTKVHQLERQKGRSLKAACERGFNERDCQRVLDESAKLDLKISRLESDYNARFVSLIGAVKTVKAIHADRRFSRKLFKKMTRK